MDDEAVPPGTPATFELELGGPAAGGGFIAHDPDGRVIFVRHGMPGERVRAVVTESHPTWARADAVEVLDRSPDRVAAPCPYAGPGACGGCDYQHVALHAQREFKRQRIDEQLRTIAGVELAVEVEAVEPQRAGLSTRTRVRFAVDEVGRLSMRRYRSHALVAVASCALGVDRVDAVARSTRAWDPGTDVEVVALDASSPPTVVVSSARGPRTRGNAERSARVLSGPDLAPGQTAVVGQHRFAVSAGVFWQVHTHGPALLVQAVLEGLDLAAGDRVCDLYCGAGLFTKAVASVVGSTGVARGVDSSRAATADARRNLAQFPWAHVQTARVDRHTAERAADASTHVVFDPPRRGVDRGALRAVSESTARRCVSVSCDPSTFARDLRHLLDAGWHLDGVRAFDLFEMTEHVELVGVLSR